jgi:hypothetical protein
LKILEKDLISIVTDNDWNEAISYALDNCSGSLVLFVGEGSNQPEVVPKVEPEPIPVPIPQPIPEKPSLISSTEEEIVKLANEFIHLSQIDVSEAQNALDNVKEVLTEAKDALPEMLNHLQSFIEENFPKVGEELRNFFVKQGQTVEDVISNRIPEAVNHLQQLVGNAEEEIIKNINALREQKEPENISALFVKDVTLSDGSLVQPSQHCIKIWEVQNNGNTSWPEGTTLKMVSSDIVESAPINVPCLKVDEKVSISTNITAPAKPGKYRLFYRFIHPATNVPFGDILWVDFVVASPYKFQSQLTYLVQMGFDESLSRYLLDEHNGNVDECVSELCSRVV